MEMKSERIVSRSNAGLPSSDVAKAAVGPELDADESMQVFSKASSRHRSIRACRR